MTEINRLNGDDVRVPPDASLTCAVGAALTAEQCINPEEFINALKQENAIRYPGGEKFFQGLHVLHIFGKNDSAEKHKTSKYLPKGIVPLLGIDTGSTSTNLVLLCPGTDHEPEVIDYIYTMTRGAPLKAVSEGIRRLQAEYGFKDYHACVTGSGRRICAEHFGITLARDEITAQSKGALFSVPGVQTIFEIGGQDSKYIRLNHGRVFDFRMNRVCAAGTGAFLQEQAERLGLSLDDFVSLALEGEKPAPLDENCTVFMEESVNEAIESGVSMENITAGLCYAVVRNYLKRVAEAEDWGDCILLQGGIAFNQGVVNAFRAVTGKKIIVPEYFSVTGALGAALIAQEEHRKTPQGIETVGAGSSGKKQKEQSYHSLLTKGYSKPAKEKTLPRIGIPRSLFLYKLFPLFYNFFRSLGMEVVFSENTDEKIISDSQKYCNEEVCYPVKLLHGHAASLLEQNIDYLFLPSLLTFKHENTNVRRECACLFMQGSAFIIDKVFNLQDRNIKLLAPSLNMAMGKKEIGKALMKTGSALGFKKPRIAAAMVSGITAFAAFQHELESYGREFMGKIDDSKPTLVLVTRAYGIHDPELNKGIPDILKETGIPVISLSNLPVDPGIMKNHANMYWPFGQHILAGVTLIRQNRNLHLVYLTNHGCGPDSVLIHYVDAIMEGKPYLHLEIDEHASNEGLRTRIEAFLNTLSPDTEPEQSGAGTAEGSDLIHDFPDETVDCSWYVPPYVPLVTAEERISATHYFQGTKGNQEQSGDKEDPAIPRLWQGCIEFIQNTPGPKSIFIPCSEGAGTDGQYPRLIRQMLDKEGKNRIKIYAPYIEDFVTLPAEQFEPFADCLVADDLRRLSFDLLRGPGQQNEIQNLEIFSDTSNSEFTLFLRPRLDRKYNNGDMQRVLITGDPWITGDMTWIGKDLAEPLLKADIIPLRIPVSEMLLFYWLDQEEKGPTANRNCRYLENQAALMHEGLGPYSPFSPDLNELKIAADSLIPGVQGSHIRYLSARLNQVKRSFSAGIHVSGLYDNGSSVLRSICRTGVHYFRYKNTGHPADPEAIHNFILSVKKAQRIPILDCCRP